MSIQYKELYLKWIKEEQEKSLSLGSKSASVYNKAYSSLASCPFPFGHPNELRMLRGFGPTICGMLEKKLKIYCCANSIEFPVEKSSKPVKKTIKGKTSKSSTANNSDTEDDSKNDKPTKTKKTRPYIPAKRSGAYAIIITLYKFQNPEGSSSQSTSINGMTKKEIIREAQPLCDASLISGDAVLGLSSSVSLNGPGTNITTSTGSLSSNSGKTNVSYSAWNSINTLLNKDLVYASGFPKRYYITPDGIELASNILKAESKSNTDLIQSKNKINNNKNNNDTKKTNSIDSLLNHDTRKTNSIDSLLNHETSNSSYSRYTFGSNNSLFLDLDDTVDLTQPNTDKSNFEFKNNLTSIEEERYNDRQYEKSKSLFYDESDDSLDFDFVKSNKTTKFGTDNNSNNDNSNNNNSNNNNSNNNNRSNNNNNFIEPTAALTSTNKFDLKNQIPIQNNEVKIWEPGTFSINLIIDNREIRGMKDRSFFATQLDELGIPATVRSLAVGDSVWVARKNDSNEEVILDYICERKRMDDLVSSIKDGRFHEQKYRLEKWGPLNVIYIVEDGDASVMNGIDFARFSDAIHSAFSSCQVCHNFFIKRTNGVYDTVVYLAAITKELINKYENKPLHVLDSKYVTAANFAKLKADYKEMAKSVIKTGDKQNYNKGLYFSFEKFMDLSSKTGLLTVKDIYVKMLMTIKGMSLEKALKVQQIYPTPSHLHEAYANISSLEARRNLLYEKCQTNDYGHPEVIARRKIGKALSAKVAEVWGDV